MRIIPAIDLMEGKCVRLCQGDFDTRKVYSADPLELAKTFENAGCSWLHLVDLDGAQTGKTTNLDVLESLASGTSMKIDFGGGLKKTEDLDRAFNAGAQQVSVGSIAVQNPDLFKYWLGRFGPSKIILAADCRDRKVAAHGWQQDSGLEIISFLAEQIGMGVCYSLVTDIEKDGMLSGPAFELYEEICAALPLNLIASGGITSVGDLQRLKLTGCEGAIIGKALYENAISLKELSGLC